MFLDRLIKPRDEKRSLSTFAGVFTPSILTILGVILYLRLSWVVGSVGLARALVIVVSASAITFITGLSISSISTNMEVKTGGAYYMISRSLGYAFGGSVGLPLYFSQALSVPLYVIGFAESLRLVWPAVNLQQAAVITIILVTIISFIGTKFVIKLQYIILLAVAGSLFSYFFSVLSPGILKYTPLIWRQAAGSPGFWAVFAVYFPAVTGILAGVSMSGDLKDPQRSIPRGTLAAIITGFLVYFTVSFSIGFCAPNSELLSNYMIVSQVARWPFLVLLGIWAATISSAFGSIMSAPRTLQALARDNIFPKFLGQGVGKQDEPLVALFLTFIIGFIAVVFGSIETIAPILTMFFLTTYGTLNFVAGLETLVKNPQYRPGFKTPWYVSLIGAGSCFAIMFIINQLASLIALMFIILIYFLLKRRSWQQAWGDIGKGFWLTVTNFCLNKLKELKNDPKNWRPNILVFSSDPEKQKELVRAAHWFAHESSIVLACNLIQGKLEENVREIIRSEKKTEQFLKEQGINAFVSTSVIENFEKDTAIIVQSAGIGDIKPNTVMFPWQEMSWLQQKHFVAMIRNQFYIGKNTVVLGTNSAKTATAAFVDIWWGGQDRNIELMLLLAHQLKMHQDWQQIKLRVLMALPAQDIKEKEEQLKTFLAVARIDAEILIIERQRSIGEHILERSGQSRMTMLGLAYPEKGTEREYYQGLAKYVQMLPLVIFVRNSKRAGVEIV